MMISTTKTRELAAYGTAGSTLMATTLGLTLFIAQHSTFPAIFPAENEKSRIQPAGTKGTVSISLQLTELDVFKQINRVYDLLLKNQVELDIDSKRALYSNLWNLYSA